MCIVHIVRMMYIMYVVYMVYTARARAVAKERAMCLDTARDVIAYYTARVGEHTALSGLNIYSAR